MGKRFRFIHAADLHLGSMAQVGRESTQGLTELGKEAVYRAFERICTQALVHEIDFLLLCGDSFDEAFPSVRGNLFFIEQCRRLEEKNIQVYFLGGNHDPIGVTAPLFRFPQNVHLFSSSTPTVYAHEEEGEVIAKIIGQSYEQRAEKNSLHEGYSLEKENILHIAMLHTALQGGDSPYIPCTLEQLKKNTSVDYWALGHIHHGAVLSEEKPMIVYAGSPQGRDLGETYLGGCFLLEGIGNKIENRVFIPTASFFYERREVDIGRENINTLEDLEKYCMEEAEEIVTKGSNRLRFPESIEIDREALKEYLQGVMVEWILIGRGKLHSFLSHCGEEEIERILQRINKSVFLNKGFCHTVGIRVRTKMPLPEKSLSSELHPVVNALEQVIAQYTEEESWKEEWKNHFRRLWTTQQEEGDSFQFLLEDSTFTYILEEAKERILDKLLEALE